MPKRILLIGPTGQVGWELLCCVQSYGQVFAVGRNPTEQPSQAYLDLSDPDSICSVIREVKPDIILNAAAYTAVDKAESEAKSAEIINAIAPGILAEEAKKLNALFVHYSTDYVFDGTQKHAYQETDIVNPCSVYGQTKLAGEQAIQAVGGSYLILRTAWVYGMRGHNFLLTIRRLAQEREQLKIVSDQIGTPTWSRMIAEATVQILAQLNSPLSQVNIDSIAGIYHLTCTGEASWYEFAKAIVAQMDKQPEVLPIMTADYPTPAKRPAFSLLSNDKLATTFGLTLPNWEYALELCLAQAGNHG